MNATIQRLEILLSRQFVVASFFPWLVFVAANLFVADVVFWRNSVIFAWALETPPATQALVFGALILTVASVAFVTSPLMNILQRIVEGHIRQERLLGKLMSHFLQARRQELEEQENQIRHRRRIDLRLSRGYEEAEKHFERAAKHGQSQSPSGGHLANAAAADEAFDAVTRMREASQDPITLFDNALSACVRACQLNGEIERLWGEFRRALEALQHRNTHDLARLLDEKQTYFGRQYIAPTRIGNIAAATETYGFDRYNILVEFFWPRLRAVLINDHPLIGSIERSETQVNFLVLSFFLIVAFTFIWTVVSIVAFGPLWLFWMVTTLGPLLGYFWLLLVAESYVAYGKIVRSALDLNRHNLLAALRMRIPRTQEEERRLWGRLRQALVYGEEQMPFFESSPR